MSQLKDVLPIIKKWHQQNVKLVLSTGVFDLLHIEHIRFLNKAKKAGDKLVIGVESDKSVKQMKGDARPINPQSVRQEQLEALKSTDLVFILPEKFNTQADWEDFVRQISPDVYAVSSHTQYLENKQHIAQKYGADFRIVHQHNPDFSTTKFHQRLLSEL